MSSVPPVLRQMLAGRYVVKREIGRGGAATVYLAHDVRHERLVAIKVLHPELSHALGVQRFRREIRLTASLQHPHILPIHDSGEVDEQLYYVMPYVEGDSLRQRLGAGNRLAVEEAVRIGREVAGALAYAHERGVVHRDIKPENILFSGGHAVLADFGIARAINRASEAITHQGTITGTPAYMSPEQARDRAFDGRSDVYSLACVMYEAIAGVPPYIGDTPQALLAQRIARRPPLLREYRHDVPPPIEAVIARALAIAPDERFDDARAFSAALSAAIGNSGEMATAPPHRRRSAGRWLSAVGIGLAVAAAAASTPAGRDRIGLLTRPVDTTQYAVLPFQYVGATAPATDVEPASIAAYDALRQWDGLPLASELSVADALHRRGDRPLGVGDVTRIARGLRAGRVVWGRVRVSADSVVVLADVYDAVTGKVLREAARAVPNGGVQALHLVDFRSLVNELLRGSRGPVLSANAERGTSSYAAWQAFEGGAAALARWDLPAAVASLERSTIADPAYPQAHLWLAQLRFLQGGGAKSFAIPLMTAEHGRLHLDARERTMADALTQVTRGDLPAACHGYDALTTRDSLDAMAWLSVAICVAQDSVVQRSPGGALSFRSSPERVLTAATHALDLDPAAFAVLPFEKLRRWFPTEHNLLRIGRAGQQVYAAWPELDGDTVAYRPIPAPQLATHALPQGYEPALRRNRDRLLVLLDSLTRRLPESADAFEALTALLERRGELDGTPNGRYSALTALDRARDLSTDSSQRLRLAVVDMRLHLKLGDFARSAAIADSLLRAPRTPSPADAALLSGVAAYAGHAALATRYDRMQDARDAQLGMAELPAAADALSALEVRVALGICDDSVSVLVGSVDRALGSYVDATRRATLRDHLLERAMTLAAPCDGGASALQIRKTNVLILRVEQLAARGDAAGARRMMDSLGVPRRASQPGAMSLDVLVLYAWASEAAGDPRTAAADLDLSLAALPSLSPLVIEQPVLAASVGRTMAYRADLAERLGDHATAAMWAGRVLTLWAHADANLNPVLARMRALAAHRVPPRSAAAAS